jgi:hypothetical protein
MPTGVYTRTLEHSKNIGLAHLGKKLSESLKEKLRKSHNQKSNLNLTYSIPKGNIPWNKGKGGYKIKLSLKEKDRRRTQIIGVMKRPEVLKKISGENCHWWKGGITAETYSVDWTKTLKTSIRQRDKYTCRLCGEKQGDRALDVHHIDYNKHNCNTNNLITLCHLCHVKTNWNRKHWKKYFELNG